MVKEWVDRLGIGGELSASPVNQWRAMAGCCFRRAQAGIGSGRTRGWGLSLRSMKRLLRSGKIAQPAAIAWLRHGSDSRADFAYSRLLRSTPVQPPIVAIPFEIVKIVPSLLRAVGALGVRPTVQEPGVVRSRILRGPCTSTSWLRIRGLSMDRATP
jgi:hypothetical protein